MDAGPRRHDETLERDFAAAMAGLGPFATRPKLAVAVSGGADSTALALLAQVWAAAQGGGVFALIVDHGLRAESAAEAALTAARLAARGMASRIITLSGLAGPGVQARARAARHDALAAAARDAGCIHLLLGHHADDQAETVAMRAMRGNGGLEGMAAWSARNDIVMIRPLLRLQSADLKAFLNARDMGWVNDPSNQDRRFERVRVRQTRPLDVAADSAPRQARDAETAAFLARHVALRPEGFAVIAADAAPAPALAALLRVVAGADYAPAQNAVAALAARLRPASLGGVLVANAGRLGPGWLLAREPAACAPPVPALAGAVWDRRFRLAADGPPGARFGALGADTPAFRTACHLPALVMRGMPCLRRETAILAFPVAADFTPPAPAAGHPFLA